MSTTALVVIGLALLVIVLMLLFARGGRTRRVNLVPLANQTPDPHFPGWDRIETRFVEAPEEAVREADALVMSILRERRHPLEDRRLPREMRDAHHDMSV